MSQFFFHVKAVCVQKATVITIKVRFDLSRSESKMIDIFSQVFFISLALQHVSFTIFGYQEVEFFHSNGSFKSFVVYYQ